MKICIQGTTFILTTTMLIVPLFQIIRGSHVNVSTFEQQYIDVFVTRLFDSIFYSCSKVFPLEGS